jgi:hypothetical protein
MEYLIGMIVTLTAVVLIVWLNTRRSSKMQEEIVGHWSVANEQNIIKNATLKRIAKALESQNGSEANRQNPVGEG